MTTRTQIHVITRSEEQPFLDALRAKDRRYYMAALTLIQTGLRVGELCSLRIADVYNGKVISKSIELTASQTKNNKARSIPLSSTLRQALYEFVLKDHTMHNNLSSHLPLFMSATDRTPISPRDFQRTFKQVGLKSIERSVNPHLLRHTFTTRMLKVMNPLDVAALLGHDDPRTTMIYNHIDIDEAAATIDRSNSQ